MHPSNLTSNKNGVIEMLIKGRIVSKAELFRSFEGRASLAENDCKGRNVSKAEQVQQKKFSESKKAKFYAIDLILNANRNSL